MTPFTSLSGTGAFLPEENIDTDIIFPARFLLLTARDGLGRYAFHDRRFYADGSEIADFVLNGAIQRDAPILIAGANFGSGSSREQAVWALLGRGIRCVIAPSFGEIFFANCFRNGVLPIVLSEAEVMAIGEQASNGHILTVDLVGQTISWGNEAPVMFDVGPSQKRALLNGWDETALILNGRGADVVAFEARHRAAQPWLFEKDYAR